MAEKKILVVDDHFEMLEFLRSMLELSNEDYEVLAVPSAEEGLMELRRTDFDLVITDVRLPGMSGFDLARQTKRIRVHTPIIMITAYSSSQGRQEAEELGVIRYFPKPLDTDEMLSAVHKALYGESVVLAQPKRGKQAAVTAVPDRVRRRLEALRTETGAAQLSLAKASGEMVLEVGDGRIPNTAQLMTILTRNLKDSFLLAQEIGSPEPFTFQYHVGKTLELYMLNIGTDYFLAMFFPVQARRGRIGTIWVFAQRAIKDLSGLLPQISQAATQPSLPEPIVETLSSPKPETPSAVVEPELIANPNPEPEEESQDWLDVEPEELAEMLASEAGGLNDTSELNAFWDEAMTETDAMAGSGGFSLEEARRQGLISDDLDLDEKAEE